MAEKNTPSITVDDCVDTKTDYAPDWTITNHSGEMVATIARVDEDDARIVVETTDHQRIYVYVGENFAWVDAERRKVAEQLPPGSRVEDDEGRIGRVVEATAEESARGEQECCSFNAGSAYVLVEWRYPEDGPDGETEREWESTHELMELVSSQKATR